MGVGLRILAIALLGAPAASPALAAEEAAGTRQERAMPGSASGLRYLGWSGRSPDPVRAPARAMTAPAAPDERPSLLRPARFTVSADERRSNVLTPASAWLPRPPAPAAPPVAPAPVPPPAPVIVPPAPAADLLPAPSGPADAPRADAPIFRLAPPAPLPGAGGAPRYYSLHRAAGRAPDPVSLPEGVMLDHFPVDLAAPERPPMVLRDARGRLVPAEAPDGSTLP